MPIGGVEVGGVAKFKLERLPYTSSERFSHGKKTSRLVRRHVQQLYTAFSTRDSTAVRECEETIIVLTLGDDTTQTTQEPLRTH